MKLKIEHVSKTFINNKVENKVLENINLDIKEGEFVSLLGPSGCGKTTLLTIIGGFQSCEEGQVLLNDKVVDKPGIDRAFVFQNYALFPWKTVKANVEFPMKQRKLSKEEREKKLEELLEISDLKGREKMYPHQLSGGMKQRVAVIRALACSPEVLLMDEPLGAVDFQMRQNLQEELESIWIKNKITAIMVTHDVDEAVYMSDRVVVMSRDKGRIIEDLKIDLDRPRNRESDDYLEYKNRLTKQLSECYV
ncbi:aliphatic sulfonate ABC transporter ATP-binding protein [[Clostridium] sordellii]|uniref:ABC-type transport system,nitrate/sulfonate/taurine ATP-binding protein n=1 Tax=Paraclostridium sordellii TaxID=1505 RepID=A0ABM9RS64_PARSO|nr:ABC transporter ATP-binding protein SaoA [Paeniclostridium sordellii]EPZ60006.1 ABC transporter family protein [[Clostridium] sordellii ATCC 9714] [Paeniclostridium sordellii ATCC 9714]CEJ74697.1 ABC-type transport system,nitrate/sulfonate/taurine ATP-binding protein [[Clostridium] sordellii] [Paeniclostridium sordellii]CEN70270.1 aliphatic sulfonate ABC transporter ATP-binding protein [[Clostridium] sordellii] [Paeniclostridium sordellii]CEN73560.1 aliphatic sulfonate ABC transporter ATP-bi